MILSFLTGRFGVGKVPRQDLATYEAERVVVLDEGVRGWITYRKFRAPGRRHGWKRRWFLGSVVLTRQRFAAYAFAERIVNLSLDDARLPRLAYWVDDSDRLHLAFEASVFHSDWAGSIEARFSTAQARAICDALTDRGAALGEGR